MASASLPDPRAPTRQESALRGPKQRRVMSRSPPRRRSPCVGRRSPLGAAVGGWRPSLAGAGGAAAGAVHDDDHDHHAARRASRPTTPAVGLRLQRGRVARRPPGATDAQGRRHRRPGRRHRRAARGAADHQRGAPQRPEQQRRRCSPRLDALARARACPRSEVLRVGLGRFPIAGAGALQPRLALPALRPGVPLPPRHRRVRRATAPRCARRSTAWRRAPTAASAGSPSRCSCPTAPTSTSPTSPGSSTGFTDGMAVRTGDIVGYVGDSGNARGGAPHLHIGIYPHGGPPIDPKPVLDQFLAEATARVPALVDAYRAGRTPAPRRRRRRRRRPELVQPALGAVAAARHRGGHRALADRGALRRERQRPQRPPRPDRPRRRRHRRRHRLEPAPRGGRLVPEVPELERDAEVVLLERGDHGLEVVALLAGDPELLALHL